MGCSVFSLGTGVSVVRVNVHSWEKRATDTGWTPQAIKSTTTTTTKPQPYHFRQNNCILTLKLASGFTVSNSKPSQVSLELPARN